jgi:3-isopropylmalate/(R)-2-methylmalate dehydratase large subunit
MAEILNLAGRVLFLSEDPALIEAQLAGRDITRAEAGKLRDDISTDEMTPPTTCLLYDERLGHEVLIGLRTGERTPIGKDALRGKFSVVVGGRRYGKGSSREHAPLAHIHAGVKLIIAESFERIFRQNADNLGLFTSTDFGLIERTRRGDTITVAELVKDRDALAARLLGTGGLLKYGKSLRRLTSSSGPARPMTLVEKILKRNVVATADTGTDLVPGKGCFVRADWRFAIEYYTPMIAHMLYENFGKPVPLHEPSTILFFEDHLTFAHRSETHVKKGYLPFVRDLSKEHQDFARVHGLRNHGYLPSGEGSEGICHAVMAEQYALPGQLVVGTDSHTPHSGALGCLAFGVGSTDMASAMVTGLVRLTVPESLRIELDGRIAAGVTAKDVVLHLLALPDIKAGGGIGKVFEFGGPAVAQLSTDERTTLTNMTAELGGFTGIVAPDAETVRFLRERRGVDFQVEPWMRSDAGATYARTIRVDCSRLTPMVASPGDPGNGMALTALHERARVDIAYGGSCTAGKREDFDQYHAVLSWAAERGLRVDSRVKLYLQFGTTAVRDYCIEKGYLAAFERVGAEMLQPSCGACAGCGPGSSTSTEQVTVSAINRNFPGRSGPGKVWLASPPTVAASAIGGRLMSFEELKHEKSIGVG